MSCSMASELQNLARDHASPGYSVKWLSSATVGERGLRGWEPVVKGGELVKYRGMILAQMPPEKKTAREEFFADLNAQQLGIHNYQELRRCWWCRFTAWIRRTF